MGSAAIILVFAGFTAYTLVNPILGVVLWALALVAAVVGTVQWSAGRRSRSTRMGAKT
ncbi:MAG: hypothetical protein M3N98_15310 [Actinomycetota bacterium]|nr:hypothetical protein [Actinomycetota bacterium]